MGQQRGDKEDRANQGKRVRQRDVGQQDFHQAIEQGVVSDVVGIETQLNQYLCEAEIVRRLVENAIQDAGSFSADEIHG